MAHKTFISYKYSEAKELRDKIIDALKEDARFYNGETSDSPDLTDKATATIKKNLTDMIFETSVTILIISPHMKESKWIDWEIEYCLKKITRKERTSHVNGIVGVIQKVNGSYDWFKHINHCDDGYEYWTYEESYLYDIIINNRFNQNPKVYSNDKHKTVDWMTGSYISFVEEEVFLNNPTRFINNAFDKSENDGDGYDIYPSN